MKLHFRQYSEDGPALVILHGLYGNQVNWAWHARKLAENFSVYVLDARNHGQSGWGAAMQLDDMVADLLETLDYLQLSQTHLLGHSMGGKVGMLFALHYPGRLHSLIVVDIAPVDYGKDRDEVLEALLALELDSLTSRGEADACLARRIPEKSVRDFLMTNLQRDGEGRFSWRINLPVIAAHFRELSGWPDVMTAFDGPALFIKGENSAYIDAGHEDLIRSRFTQSKVQVVEDAGHWVHSEKPETVQGIVHQFLAAQAV